MQKISHPTYPDAGRGEETRERGAGMNGLQVAVGVLRPLSFPKAEVGCGIGEAETPGNRRGPPALP